MNFSRGHRREEPEINFIPLIDVLLVILIFLMVSTTYNRYAALKINLPSAQANPAEKQPVAVEVAIDRNGRYVVNHAETPFQSVEQFGAALRRAAGAGPNEVPVVIHADAQTAHQAVINVMEAARAVGLTRITFATQAPAS